MIRELFHLGPLAISPFGVMLVLAFFSAYLQLRSGLSSLGIGDEEDASSLLFAGGVGGILGAKIYYAILYRDVYLLFDRSGLVWYGGFILGTAAVVWTIRRRRLPFGSTLDAMAPALAVGYGIGRIGCFLVGDDYGMPSDLPWAVKFPVGLPPTRVDWLVQEFGLEFPAELARDTLVSVHPTQIYETLGALAIWLVGRHLLKGHGKPGFVALPIISLLAVERFLVEFLRAKDDRLLGMFTVAQAISLLILLIVASIWWSRRRRS